MKVDKKRCLYCGGCVGVCPQHAMELKEVIVEIDPKKCTNCGICFKFCPVGAIEKD
jgi:ferredoxin